MNALQKWRNDRGYTRERVADMFGLKWGTIQSYELGRRTPLLSTRKLIQRVTRGAVPTWCWGWQVFVFEDAKTWPEETGEWLEFSEGDGEYCGEAPFAGKVTAKCWKIIGITHWREKGDGDGV